MNHTSKLVTGTGHDRPDGVVLCGGAGRRIGGRDKGLLCAGSLPAAAIAAGLLAPCCSTVFISANRHLERYRDLAIGPVITDRRPGHAGPLAGLEAVAAATASDRLLVLPCDLPRLGRQVPETLLASLESDGDLDAVYASAAGRHHYLVAALRTRALANVGHALDRGEHAVRDWLGGINTRSVCFDGPCAAGFANHNRLEDWQLPGGAGARGD